MNGLPLTSPHSRPFGVENQIRHTKVFPRADGMWRTLSRRHAPPQAISMSRQEGRMRSQEMMNEAKVM